jgi:hypothetical protein
MLSGNADLAGAVAAPAASGLCLNSTCRYQQIAALEKTFPIFFLRISSLCRPPFTQPGSPAT